MIEDFDALADAAMESMMSWDLRRREREIAGWVIALSYRRGRTGFFIESQNLFCELTGLDERGVSVAVRALKSLGVLQVSGPRCGPYWYEWLPNGRLIEPAPVADPQRVRAALAQIEEANRPGPGCYPGGQRRLAITTVEDRLAEEQADASRRMALERQLATFDGDGLSKKERALFPKRKDEEVIPPGAPYSRASGGAGRNTCTQPTADVYVDVGCAGAGDGEGKNGDVDVLLALETVERMVPPAEFVPWRQKWQRRCEDAPQQVLLACGDVREYARRNKVHSFGRAIFRRAQKLCSDVGKRLSML